MPHDASSRIDAPRHDIWGFRMSMLLLAGYAAIHLLLRLLLADSIGNDHAVEHVFAQMLAFGYDIKQPPLFTWIAWLIQQATGPVFFSFLLLKYALLLTTFAFYYRVAERLFTEPRFAALAAWSLLMLYQIGWNSHEGVTQTQVLTTSCAGTLLAFLRAAERPGWGRYAVLGVAIAAGILSKLSYGAFIVSLVAAALWRPAYRPVLLTPRIVVTVAVALLLVAPYAGWVVGHETTIAGVFKENLAGGGTAGTVVRLGNGLLSVVLASLGFLSPLLPLLVILFPAAWRPGCPPDATVSEDLERLLRDMLIVGAIILVFGVVAAGVRNYKERWLHPFYLGAPLYFWARVRRSNPGAGRLKIYIGIFLATTVAVVGVRAARLEIGPPLCNHCLPNVPYKPFTDQLAAAGFQTGTIVTPNIYTAANLRTAFPAARIYALTYPMPLPPPPDAPGRKCLLVWPTDYDWQKFPTAALPYLGLPADAAATLDIKSASAPWPHPWRPAGERMSHWKYVLFDRPMGQCG